MAKSAASAAVLALLGSGCQALSEHWPLSEGRGAPRRQFAAADGDYFPVFIRDFFPASRMFEASHPKMTLARDNMLVIEVRRLNAKDDPSNEANLSWSADSHYLGYEVITNKMRKILVKNLVGDYSEELVVLENRRSDFLRGMVTDSVQSYNAGLRWSLDRAEFVFMSNGGNGEFNLYVGGVGRDKRPVAESPTKDGYAVWNPSDREIAFVSARSGNGDIYLADLGSGEPAKLSASDDFDLFPEWFPGGDRIVYCSGEAARHNLMTVGRKNGAWGSPTPLTDWEGDDLRPTVSPNGRYVAFYSSAGGNAAANRIWNLHVIPFQPGRTYTSADLNGTVVARDVVVDLNTGIAWTPDGLKLLFVKKDPRLFNPIMGYDLMTGKQYLLKTGTKMNRDIMMSSMGILSFRSQVGAWDRVFLALTNQGRQLQESEAPQFKIVYPEI